MRSQQNVFKILVLAVLVVVNAVIISFLAGKLNGGPSNAPTPLPATQIEATAGVDYSEVPPESLQETPQPEAVEKEAKVPGANLYLPMIQQSGQPAPISGDVAMGSNLNWVTLAGPEETQTLHVFGEIENGSGQSIQQVLIRADLLGKDDVLLQSVQGATLAAIIPSGGKSCFDLTLPLPAGFKHAKAELLSFNAVEADLAHAVYVTNAGYEAKNEWYALRGVVTPQIGAVTGDVQVVGTLYDKAGKVIGCDQTFASFHAEDPTQPGIFNLYFMDTRYQKAASYEVEALSLLP